MRRFEGKNICRKDDVIKVNGTPLNVTIFPDNTSQVWKLDPLILENTDYYHVTWEYSHEGELVQLAQLKDIIDLYGATATLRIKYLPYGRQDKEVSNEATFALRTFAKLLNSLNFQEIIIMDPHSVMAIELISNSRATYPVEDVMKIAYELKADLFCYPDKGAVSKYTGDGDAKKEIYDYPCVYGDKVRNQSTGHITSYKLIGNVKDKKVLIVDDICDGGMTFKILAKDLLEAGASEVNLFVTHGVFSKGLKTLKDSNIKRIFTQDGEASEVQNNIAYRRL